MLNLAFRAHTFDKSNIDKMQQNKWPMPYYLLQKRNIKYKQSKSQLLKCDNK